MVLPSDFASALEYNLANGSEPYLPSFISMRYASYQAQQGVAISSVYITYPFSPFNPPTTINVGGITYILKSSYGEQRGNTSSAAVVTIAGPQGPPGSGGGGAVTSVTGGTGISVSPTVGAVVVSNTGLISFAPTFTSSNITLVAGALITIAHGLGRLPYLLTCIATCVTNDTSTGFVAGDVLDIPISNFTFWNGASTNDFGMYARLNSVDIFIGVAASGLLVLNKTTFTHNSMTLADWHFVFNGW